METKYSQLRKTANTIDELLSIISKHLSFCESEEREAALLNEDEDYTNLIGAEHLLDEAYDLLMRAAYDIEAADQHFAFPF